MKKYLIALAAIISAIIVIAQSQIWVYQSDGTRYSYDYSMFDSLSRVTPGTLALSQSERTIPCEGETFNLAIYASQPWKATVSDAKRVSLSKMQGDGNDDISVKVSVNKQSEKAYSTITFQLADGTKNSITLIAEEWEDKLTINPSSKLFTPAGGTFKMGISSNTDWKVSASEPWITFDKTSGTLNDSIKITVGKGDTDAARATITVTTTNGKTATCTVIHEGDKVSVSPATKTLPPAGGTYKIGVTSNTDWTVSTSEPWVTFDKTKGTFNDSIVVTIGKGDKDAASAEITITTSNGKTATCTVIHDGDNVSVSPASKTLPPAGGTYKIGITSNTDWTISASEPWVTFDKTKGTLNDSIVVTVGKGNKDAASAEIIITTSNSKTATCTVIHEGDKISVSPTTKEIKYEGGTIDVSVSSNTEWIASSNKNWVLLSKGSGTGDLNLKINVNAGIERDTATITYYTANGKSATLMIYRLNKGDDVTDINGNIYPTIWINGQNWMAENLKCNKYDTKSEAYNASWLTNNTIPITEERTSTPYYTDASDKSKWDSYSKQYGVNLTDEQVAKLGYLYNWAAAVGVADGEKQTTAFSGTRQGICPNGWHVPSRAEWQMLYDYIYKDKNLSSGEVGKYLKTTSGWSGGYYDGNGLDSYGFAALPAGSFWGDRSEIGGRTYFWTDTPHERPQDAYIRFIFEDDLHDDGYWRIDGYSVRCIRD